MEAPGRARNPLYRQTLFLGSAASLAQAPPDAGLEVAFAGRSNAGKSSAINALCDHQGLARTSKTPGRTQQLVFFLLDERHRLVDLPGYGYARVAESLKRQWQGLMADYLNERRSLRGLILVADIRQALTDYDWQMLEWGQSRGLPMHLLLTKADKLKHGPASAILLRVRKELAARQYAGVSLQRFSALRREGIEASHEVLDRWLDIPRPNAIPTVPEDSPKP